MNICLITPPSPFLLDERVFCALGVLKVAASLEQEGHQVDVLDLSGVTNYEDVVSDYVSQNPDRIYGITATSPQMPAAKRIASRLPRSRMLGGPHATLVHAAARTEARGGFTGRARRSLQALGAIFPTVIAGDGEKAIHRALKQDGVIDADDPSTELFLTHKSYSETPWPARHLIDIDSYKYSINGERATSVITQLGCPMGCKFCGGRNSPTFRRIRVRPAENAVAEICHLHDRYGYKGINFFDDELNVNKEMLTLMRALKREADARGIQWKLRGFLKAELFTEEQAEAMYQAGFRQVLIGFEAASPRILLNIQKNATVEDNTRAVQIAHKHGLQVKALMSIGHAGETEETALAIRDWLLQVKPEDFDCTIITPYPGSPYYDEAVPQGEYYRYTSPKTGDVLFMADVDFTQEAQFYKGHPGEYVSHVWTPDLTPERLVQLRDRIEQEVRTALKIPFYPSGTAIRFEHSMGQGMSFLPKHILKRSN